MPRRGMRPLPTLLVLGLVASCGGGTSDAPAIPVERHLDAEALAALPVDTLAAGQQVCLATGYDACPLHFALATRLDETKIALWEPGHAIGVLRAGDSMPRSLAMFSGTAPAYPTVMAIRKDGKGYDLIDVEDGGYGLVRLDAEGRQIGRTPLPHVGALATVGFSAGDPVLQDFTGWENGGQGMLTVRRLKAPTDSIGTLILEAPVPWMQGASETGPSPRPLFAGSPLWTRVPGGDVVWSPGTTFRVERRAPAVTGAVKWVLTGPDGPRVTAEDLDRRERTIREAMAGLPFSDEEFDQMRTRSDSIVPPLSGFVPYPDGGLLIMGALAPSQPTTTWIRLDKDGVPVSRFDLDTRARILLAEGDSVLVHRPTESEPWEVLWMRLQREK
ncbi:MAG TPA: hypothetical protein VFN22_03515 [Gemmatimonadales bacterium]|nr:hypothetical protein [Gemmatimonadales bacterium]